MEKVTSDVSKEGNKTNGKGKEIALKKCFIITPIGDERSEIRRKTDGLIRTVIAPVLANLGYNGDPAHSLSISGSITKTIIERILNDELVIANLSGLNPNVMYELAIRHAKRKPVVILAEEGTQLPFDVATEFTIFFTNDFMGVEDLRSSLTNAIISAEMELAPDNPIYRVVEASIMQEVIKGSANEMMMQQLSRLATDIEHLKQQNKPSKFQEVTKYRNSYKVEIFWKNEPVQGLLLEELNYLDVGVFIYEDTVRNDDSFITRFIVRGSKILNRPFPSGEILQYLTIKFPENKITNLVVEQLKQ